MSSYAPTDTDAPCRPATAAVRAGIDRAVGGIAIDAGVHGGGGGTVVGACRTHADSPWMRSAVARMASMRSVSFRKASWP